MKLLIVVSLLGVVQGYHILCVFPVPTRSHNTLGKGIVQALLEAGHEVTWATPYPPTQAIKGLNIIDVSVTINIFEGLDVIKIAKLGISGLTQAKAKARNVTMTALTSPLKKALIETQFDAVVTEMFFSEIEAGYAAVQQVPWILLSGTSLQPPLEGLVDAVNSVPVLPSLFADFEVPLNFWQRIVSVALLGGVKLMSWLEAPQNTEHYEAMFAPIASARGVPLPPFEAALYNISVLLVNAHPSFASAPSIPPNVIDVAGYHINEDIEPLPKDLQDLLDGSPQGVVYFSMGSIVQSAAFPEETRRLLLKVFGDLPQTVLWKFEESLEGLPKNVHIKKWMPQDGILAHPNVKAFITHGGMLSNIEAVHHGVPLISIPLYGDQPANANRAARARYAIKLDFDFETLPDQLRLALKEILVNDSYYKRAQYLSSLFRNRPVSPSRLVSHSIEIAIESKGAYHLRSKALLYPWYQRCLLDIAAFFIFILILLNLILKRLANLALSLCLGRKPKNIERKEKKLKRN